MAMTREQVLAEMEADYKEMSEAERSEVLFNHDNRDWTPTQLIQEVRDNTEYGQGYVSSWSQSKEQQASLAGLLDRLFGGALTCGDPDCPNCKGEVRPFNQDASETIH